MLIISGGHQIGGGANGYLNETTEDRNIVSEMLKLDKNIVDVSINYDTNATTELIEKVKKVNSYSNVDCYADIHLNAGGGRGVEVYVLDYSTGLYANRASYDENYNKAKRVCDAIANATGLVNRGVKTNKDFYVLTKPVCHSILVEACFVDSLEDKEKYNASKIAKAIYEGLTGNVVVDKPVVTPSNKKYLNLLPHVTSWRVYPMNVSPVVGNECAKLAPSNYGGLSYEINEDRGNIKVITTEMFGKVQIFAPRDEDSTITDYPIY